MYLTLRTDMWHYCIYFHFSLPGKFCLGSFSVNGIGAAFSEDIRLALRSTGSPGPLRDSWESDLHVTGLAVMHWGCHQWACRSVSGPAERRQDGSTPCDHSRELLSLQEHFASRQWPHPQKASLRGAWRTGKLCLHVTGCCVQRHTQRTFIAILCKSMNK